MSINTTPLSTGGGLIRPLHGIRGIAAITVLLGHYIAWPRLAPGLGVLLFYILSGYLIGHLYLSQRPTREAVYSYAVARFARVYPLFAIVVLAAGLLWVVEGDGPFNVTGQDVLPHLLLAGSGRTIWTVSVEFQFYASFILIWLLASTGKVPAAFWWLLIVALAIVGFSGVFTGRIDFLRYAHIFALGVGLAALLKRGPDPTLVNIAAIAVIPLLLAYVVAFFVTRQFYFHDLVYSDPVVVSLCFALVAAVVAAPASPGSRLLGVPVLFWLGEISFGIYLLHRPFQWFVERAPWVGDIYWMRVSIALALTLATASLANRFIERPARSAIRAIAATRQRQSAQSES